MAKIIIDAENTARGRVASIAAKEALGGNEVIIINSEKALISGRDADIINDFKARRALNTINPGKGPYFSKSTEKIMKKTIRGMLPDFRVGRGRDAWKKIRCYNGVPAELKNEKATKLKFKVPAKNIDLAELSRRA
jgi:large subunit ribosomal protein L13